MGMEEARTLLGSTGDVEESIAERSRRRRKYLKTMSFGLAEAAHAAYSAILGATMVDLTQINDFNYAEISTAASLSSLGIILGSPLGALVAEKFASMADLFICVILLVAGGVCSVSIPYVSSLPVLGVLWILQGAAYGASAVLTYTSLVIIWDEKRAPGAVLVVNAVWSLGSFMSPLIATPFLSGSSQLPAAEPLFYGPHFANDSNHTYDHGFLDNDVPVTRLIAVPYIIIGAFGVLVAVQFFVYWWLGWNSFSTYEEIKENEKNSVTTYTEQELSGSYSGQPRCSVLWFFVVIGGFLFIGLGVARDNSYSYFAGTIGVESVLAMTPKTASLLVTSFNASKGLSRIAAAFITHLVSFQVILFISTVIPAVGAIILKVLGIQLISVYWVLIVIIGLASGPGYSLFFVWVKHYLGRADPFVNGSIQAGQATGNFMALWGSGYMLQRFGPETWMSYEYIVGVGTFVVLAVLQLAVSGKSFLGKKTQFGFKAMDNNANGY